MKWLYTYNASHNDKPATDDRDHEIVNHGVLSNCNNKEQGILNYNQYNVISMYYSTGKSQVYSKKLPIQYSDNFVNRYTRFAGK